MKKGYERDRDVHHRDMHGKSYDALFKLCMVNP